MADPLRWVPRALVAFLVLAMGASAARDWPARNPVELTLWLAAGLAFAGAPFAMGLHVFRAGGFRRYGVDLPARSGWAFVLAGVAIAGMSAVGWATGMAGL